MSGSKVALLAIEMLFDQIDARIEQRLKVPQGASGDVAGWYGLRAHERARPLTDLGRRLLGLHVATTTPKEN